MRSKEAALPPSWPAAGPLHDRATKHAFWLAVLAVLSSLVLLCGPTGSGAASTDSVGGMWSIGQLIVYGPPLLLGGMLWCRRLMRSCLNRELNVAQPGEQVSIVTLRDCACWKPLMLTSAVAVIWLVAQFFQFAPAGQCASFSPGQLLLDSALSEPFRPDLCLPQVSAQAQRQMPWIYPPLQGWLYLLMAFTAARLAWRTCCELRDPQRPRSSPSA